MFSPGQILNTYILTRGPFDDYTSRGVVSRSCLRRVAWARDPVDAPGDDQASWLKHRREGPEAGR